MFRDKCAFLVVGAGVIGLTIARELSRRGAEDIVVIDKEAALGEHASGRNSGVLHAGIYYTLDTLKARFAVAGNRAWKAYCREKQLPVHENGKVIVARDEAEVRLLAELEKRARDSGARVRLIDAGELREIEPHVRTCELALYSPETAVVEPKRILTAVAEELRASGKVTVCFSTGLVKVIGNRTVLTTKGKITFERMINAAGAYADRIAHQFGVARDFCIIPFKGTYHRLRSERSHLVRTNIYPVPDLRNPFLGVHFTKSVSGEVTIGPTAIPAFGRENYGLVKGLDIEAATILRRDVLLFFVNPSFRAVALREIRKYSKNLIWREAQRLVPAVTPADIISCSKVGIRPQLVNWREKKLVMDFLVIKEGDSIHVLNAISPAFTCALPFAGYVVDKLLQS